MLGDNGKERPLLSAFVAALLFLLLGSLAVMYIYPGANEPEADIAWPWVLLYALSLGAGVVQYVRVRKLRR